MLRSIYVDPIRYLKSSRSIDNPINIHNDERTDKLMKMSDGWNRFLRKVLSSELEVTFLRVKDNLKVTCCFSGKRCDSEDGPTVTEDLRICRYFYRLFFRSIPTWNPPFFDRYWHDIARCSLKAFLPPRWDHNCFHEDSNTFFDLYP